jgi:ABC-type bacteriocin/lantibiotic exporter with double-glycine peptidase domain
MDAFFWDSIYTFLMHLNPTLTLFSILIVPIEFFVFYLWKKVRITKADKSVDLENEHRGTLVESISGAETIYQTDSFEFFNKIWFQEIVAIVKNSVSLKKIDTIFSLIFGFMSKFSSLFIWLYGISLVMNDKMTLGQFITVDKVSIAKYIWMYVSRR